MESMQSPVPWQQAGHTCHLPADDAEAAEVLVAYVAEALADPDARTIVAAPPQALQQLREQLPLAEAEVAGRVTLTDAAAHFGRLAAFDPESTLAYWVGALAQAEQAGYARLYVARQTPPQVLQLPGSDRLVEYEARLDVATRNHAVCTLCQYGRHDFPPELLQGIVLIHPWVLVDGQACANPSHIAADRLLEAEPHQAALDAMLSSIRETAQAHAALEASEERHRTVADYTYDWEIWHGAQGETLYMSPSCERVTGYTREEFLADQDLLSRIIHSEDRAVLTEHIRHAHRERADGTSLEVRVLHRDGTIRWIHHHCQSIWGDDGRYLGRRASNRDITRQREAEQRLQELLVHLRRQQRDMTAVFNNAGVGIVVADPSGRLTMANPAMAEFLGTTPEALIGRTVAEITHPDDMERETALVLELLHNDRTRVATEKRYVRADGTAVWGSLMVTPLQDAEDGTPLLVGMVQDIDARKRAEAELQQVLAASQAQAAELEAIIGAMTAGVVVFGANAVVQRANAVAKALIRKPVFEGLSFGTYLSMLQVKDAAGRPLPLDQFPVARGLRGETVHEEVVHVAWDDGSGTWFAVSVAPVPSPQGQIESVVTVLQDVTEMRQTQARIEALVAQLEEQTEELTRHRDRLEELVAERTQELVLSQDNLRRLATEISRVEERERQRIATAIHDEISQRLAFLRMQAQAVRSPASLADVAARGDALDRIIGETIAISRRLTMELSPPVLYEMSFNAALQWLGERMEEQHGYAVHVAVTPTCRGIAQDQRVMLFRSTQELLTNAAKHAQCENVWVALDCGGNTIELVIRDDGRGFDHEAGAASDGGGFGLLSIRERAASMGGQLHMSGSPGAETVFRLSLPRQDTGQDEPPP